MELKRSVLIIFEVTEGRLTRTLWLNDRFVR